MWEHNQTNHNHQRSRALFVPTFIIKRGTFMGSSRRSVSTNLSSCRLTNLTEATPRSSRMPRAAGAQIFIPNDSRANYDTDGSFRAMGRLLFAADEGIFTYAGQAECTSGRSTIPRYREVRKAANFSSGLPKGRRSQSGRPAARRWPRGLWGIGLSIILCNRRKWTRSGCSRLVERHAE